MTKNKNLKPKLIREEREGEGYYILTKGGKIHQDYTVILNICELNMRTFRFIKKAITP